MARTMIELVVFDADGVLFDSDESNVAYYNAIFHAVGEPPLSPEEARDDICYAASQIFENRARGDREKISRMHEVAGTLDFRPFFELLRPPLELRPFMLELRRRYRLGLATNRSATIPALIEHLSLHGVFDAVASPRDKVKPKPAPDILKLCLERAGVGPERAVYVGDSPIDIEASAGAGMRFIGVGGRIDHHTRITSLAELPEVLERLPGE